MVYDHVVVLCDGSDKNIINMTVGREHCHDKCDVTWKKISGCSLGLWGWRFLARVTVSWRGGWNTIELSVANKHLTDDFILFFFPTGITGATEQLAPPTRRLGLIKDLGRSTESLLVTRNRSSSHPPPLLDPPVPSVQLH